jgi:hypothetical protein
VSELLFYVDDAQGGHALGKVQQQHNCLVGAQTWALYACGATLSNDSAAACRKLMPYGMHAKQLDTAC